MASLILWKACHETASLGMEINIRKTVIITIDGLGVGELPDAFRTNHRGANTLQHLADQVGKLNIPNLGKLGLGNLTYIRGVERTPDTLGFYSRCRFKSEGTGVVSGHWEIAGVIQNENFFDVSLGISSEFRELLQLNTRRDFLIMKWPEQENLLNTFGAEHLISGKPLLLLLPYSEILVCAHENVLTRNQLMFLTMDVRQTANTFHIAMVSMAPLEGEPGDFLINFSKKESFPMPAPGPTLLDSAELAQIPVVTLGEVAPIFANRAITTGKSYSSLEDFFEKLVHYIRESPTNDFEQTIIWARYSDLWEVAWQKRDAHAFTKLLEEFDSYIPRLYRAMASEDMLIITSSHGGDFTIDSKNPTREHVPVLTYCRNFKPQGYGSLVVRKSASDIAETLAEAYELPIRFAADSFWPNLLEKL
ncbi:MAG: hypothetical protein NZM25_11275 [Leptospiraceae bacterium]|nr:hypothetical protein [Leptospiraceae bacterium]MDW8307594.1 hypothetical protein [Leptospiraceae bacterium]